MSTLLSDDSITCFITGSSVLESASGKSCVRASEIVAARSVLNLSRVTVCCVIASNCSIAILSGVWNKTLYSSSSQKVCNFLSTKPDLIRNIMEKQIEQNKPVNDIRNLDLAEVKKFAMPSSSKLKSSAE